MTHTVRIEDVFEVTGRGVFVAVSLPERSDLVVGATATIGDCPIEPWVEMPRRVLSNGQPDLNYFVVKLRDAADRTKLQPGQTVALIT